MNDLTLIKPSEEYIDEIRAFRQEFIDDGGHFNGVSGLGQYESIAAWIEQCRLMENKETLPNPDWVEADQFMLVRKGDSRVLGMINFRHYLNEQLATTGGHIGYGVRPSERRKGYAKLMLSLCLEKCREYGLDKALITCDKDNEASRRTILSNGGVFDGETQTDDGIVERYWLTLLDSKFKSFIYGTGNPAKLASMRNMLSPLGIEIVGIKEIVADIPEPEENGNTPPENARIKALAYYAAVKRPVFACDSGFYIDGLPDSEQPGVHVRRVGGKSLTDEEMTAHYAAIAHRLGGKAVARYNNAICLVMSDDEIYEYSGEDINDEAFYLVDTPHSKRVEGFPFDCISVHIGSGKYYYDIEELSSGVDSSMVQGFQAFFRRVIMLGAMLGARHAF